MKKTKLVGALLAGVIATTGVPGLVQPMSISICAASKLAAPSGLKASASGTSVKLTWSAVSGADAYRVFILNNSTGKYETAKNVSGTTAKIDGLDAGKTYKFKVAALVKSGSSYKVQTASAAAAVKTLLAAPTGLTASASGSTIKLSWKAVSGATGYRVFVADGDSYKALKDVSGTSVSVKVTSGGTYKYKVAALVKSGGKTAVQTQSGAVKVNVKVAESSSKGKLNISFPAFGTSKNAAIKAMGLSEGIDITGYLNAKFDIGAYGGYKNINGEDCMVILYFNGKEQFFYGLIMYTGKVMPFSDLFSSAKAKYGKDYISVSSSGTELYEWVDVANKQVRFIIGMGSGSSSNSMYGEMSLVYTPQEMLSGNNDITGALTDISSLLNPQ